MVAEEQAVFQSILRKLGNGQDLSVEEAEKATGYIMSGLATPAQVAGFLTALHLKGETTEEITGCALAMRRAATRVQPKASPLVDTCGTGGDGLGTFNISTAAAFVVAGAGVPVAKHGNRAASSRSGSADVLEALGVNINAPPHVVSRCIDEAGIGFLFAQVFHPAMRHAAGPRRELGFRTVFNILGPLSNPAGATRQVLGVYDPSLTERMARVLGLLGAERALVVHGAGGMDEFSTLGTTRVSELGGGKVVNYEIAPEDVGLGRARLEDLLGGAPEVNARMVREVLDGVPGPRRDIVLLNAAAALVAADRARSLREGIALAAESIDSGRARAALDALVEYSHGA